MLFRSVGANISTEMPLGVTYVSVTSTVEMLTELKKEFSKCDALFMAAAVADAKPIDLSETKIRKDSFQNIALEKNPDILKELSRMKKPDQVLVGFSAETGDSTQVAAMNKLKDKSLDLIYTNDVSSGKIFGEDKTEGWIIDEDGSKEQFLSGTKATLANLLLDKVRDKLG